ncbi:MAG: hypothetical protein DUW69_000651 [Verrucomicrobia bacterium]|nr:MAG: hypothetical protein DUW69_000651 [Verrucomicrobiota bacterium]
MKNNLLSLILLGGTCAAFAPTQTYAQSSERQSIDAYYAGWKSGWAASWKQVKGEHSYSAYAPDASYPNYGQLTYQGGYNAGFLAGFEAVRGNGS